ncbi:MAG: hypothetical protein LBD20_04985, partial [Spirochaetaceae bacterium]|nr:hypothetical protein [Spirochaetaceae bacterium]
GNLNTFAGAPINQPANSIYFGYISAAVSNVPSDPTTTGFFTSEIGVAANIHQTFRPVNSTRVWERYSSNSGGAWSAWARTDGEFAAASLNVRNVGNITAGSLDTFVTMSVHTGSQQAQYSTCYAFVGTGVSGKPTGQTSTTGFFTSYLGTYSSASNYVSRQEYRPTDSNNVYERNKNGSGSWSGWVLINAPVATTPTQLTITKASQLASDGYQGANFINGFLTVYVALNQFTTYPGAGVYFTIPGVNIPDNISMYFPVTFVTSTQTNTVAFLRNSDNNLHIVFDWITYPTNQQFNFSFTVPAVLKP